MKKALNFLILAAVFVFSREALAQEKIKIGILKISAAPHYETGVKGILQEFKKSGYDENRVKFDIRDAGGSMEKSSEIAGEFKKEAVDLVMSLGTVAAMGVSNAIKDIPVVFALVYDPLSAGLIKSWENSGNNVTGISNWVNIYSLVQVLRYVCPAKKIGVLYAQDEKNTIFQLEEFKKLQKEMGFEVVEANINKLEDLKPVLFSLYGRIDALYVGGETLLSAGIKDIVEDTIKYKIPTIAILQERLEAGVLFSVSSNSLENGELAAKKAIQVLEGAKPSDIAVEYLKKFDIGVNLKTAKLMGINIPVNLLEITSNAIKE